MEVLDRVELSGWRYREMAKNLRDHNHIFLSNPSI